MSFSRFVYYSAVVGGWAALLAWAVLEAVFLRGGSTFTTGQVTVVGTVVGSAIGAGLHLVSGISRAQWQRQIRHALPGLVGGAAGGAVGALLGQVLVAAGLPFALGWIVMGAAIGVAEGIYERSPSKIRNGLIGGALGGLVGGLLFWPISQAGSDVSSRATALVILGVSIGALIGLAQVVLKEAWLTVVDGFRPGRQLILSQPVTVLGRGDHLPLPLLGYSGRDLEAEHARITRNPDGSFTIEDNLSRLGTRLNGHLIQGAVALADGDLIKLGTNIIRFNVRHGVVGGVAAAAPGQPAGGRPVVPPPPPPPVLLPTTPTPPALPGGPPRQPPAPQAPPRQAPPPNASPRIPPPPPPLRY
jgi:hypothetical protein